MYNPLPTQQIYSDFSETFIPPITEPLCRLKYSRILFQFKHILVTGSKRQDFYVTQLFERLILPCTAFVKQQNACHHAQIAQIYSTISSLESAVAV